MFKLNTLWLVARNKAYVIPKGDTLDEKITAGVKLRKQYMEVYNDIHLKAIQAGELETAQAIRKALDVRD